MNSKLQSDFIITCLRLFQDLEIFYTSHLLVPFVISHDVSTNIMCSLILVNDTIDQMRVSNQLVHQTGHKQREREKGDYSSDSPRYY